MARQKRKKIILPFLARHSVFDLLSYEKTGIYVKDNHLGLRISKQN